MLSKTPLLRAVRGAGALLVGLCLVALSACTSSQPPRQVVGEFVGFVDTQSGTMTIRMAPQGASVQSNALTVIGEDHTGGAGTGAPDTVELVTVASSLASTDTAGANTNGGCGRPGSFCGAVTIRSFYATNELHNVYAEITSMTPATGNLGFWKTAQPTTGQPGFTQVSASFGLWAYPTLLDSTRGAVGTGTAPGANAATRTWYFDSFANTSFHFQGRVWADVVASGTSTNLGATCGGSANTALNTTSNCGECGRTCPGDGSGTPCTYAASVAGSQANAWLSFQCNCPGGQTACDTGNAMAFACKDLQSDPANCGVCGNACGGTNTCVNGVCTGTTPCASGYTACSTRCCPAGSTCTAGLCILSDALEVSVGADHACAATTTTRLPTQAVTGTPTVQNNVVCWGSSWWQHLNDPIWSRGFTVPEFNDPNFALPGNVSNLSAGGRMTVGMASPTVWRWGYESLGGNDISGYPGAPVKVARGGSHGCEMQASAVYCWGVNTSGQLGNGTTTGGDPFQPPVLGVGGTGTLVASQISAAGDTTCAVLGAGTGQTAGTVACWGDNTNGKAGGPLTDAHYLSPHLVQVGLGGTPTALSNVAAVSVGGNHTVALLNDGSLAFWGLNDSGQFGTTSAAAPELVTTRAPSAPTGGTPTNVSAGQDFTCYVAASGNVWCHGKNDLGQLGNGAAPTGSLVPVQVLGVTGAATVSAGGVPTTGDPTHGGACARVGGNVYCWGDNANGQVGVGSSTTTFSTPQLVQLEPAAHL